MNLRYLWRTWAACLIACLPILILLLVPQLMRSRAGSASSLMLGVALLLALLVAAFVCAPVMSAWLSPAPGWRPRTALRAAGAVWRRRTRDAAFALLAGIGIYAAGQVIGYLLAEAVPHVHDNPAFATDPSLPRWIVDYPAFVLQAVVLYAMTTAAVAVYAWRMRALSLRSAAVTEP